ncbi:MAG: SusD/RagB family nutrient-binding outer membrane lipoprotein [Chitinophagaceae bacterium]
MKYIKKKKALLIVAATLSLLAGCKKDFLDINDNPNNPTDNNITPELIFVAGAEGAGARQASGNFRFLNSWVGYASAAGDFAIVQDETTYNIDFSFSDPIWANHFNVLFDLHLAKQKALAKGDSVLAGASMILSAKLWQELVDIFGNIPYSQAFQNNATRVPDYDNAKDIYIDLQKKLDTAKTYMSATAKLNFNSYIGAIVKIGPETLGGGTVSAKQANWIKFANTLKLRLLIRQSETSGFNPAAEIAKMTIGGTLNILREGQTVAVNPGYVNDDNKQSPFYGVYGFTPTGGDANTSTRANKYIVDVLKANGDVRLNRYFAPVGASVVGTVFGAATGNPGGAASSKFGPGLLGDAAEGPSQDQWIFPSFLSLFLEAEAITRGWVTGSAQTAYENAVRESFVWLGVPNAAAAATSYLATPVADWANSGATPLAKAKFIAYQKYLSLVGIDPLEAWSDIRRLNMVTNMGYITVNPGRIGNVLPNRLLYPQTEYTTNATNVNAEGTVNLFTSKIFWQP